MRKRWCRFHAGTRPAQRWGGDRGSEFGRGLPAFRRSVMRRLAQGRFGLGTDDAERGGSAARLACLSHRPDEERPTRRLGRPRRWRSVEGAHPDSGCLRKRPATEPLRGLFTDPGKVGPHFGASIDSVIVDQRPRTSSGRIRLSRHPSGPRRRLAAFSSSLCHPRDLARLRRVKIGVESKRSRRDTSSGRC